MSERRPLPILDGVYVSPRAAPRLAAAWDRYVVPGLRADGVEHPPEELLAIIEACRIVGARRLPDGTAGIPPEGEDAIVRPVMTTTEVADLLGCSARNVRALRSRGRLLGRRRDPRHGWLYDPAEVDAYIEEHRAQPA